MAGVVALFFAARLTAAAFSCGFSPASYLPYANDAAALAWLLAGALAGLGVLLWLVLRHGDATLWLASPDGGVLVRAADLQTRAGSAAVRRHPDVLRAEVELSQRGQALRARARVKARPLAPAGAVAAAVEEAVRASVTRLAGRDLERVDVRVRVLSVRALARYLP